MVVGLRVLSAPDNPEALNVFGVIGLVVLSGLLALSLLSLDYQLCGPVTAITGLLRVVQVPPHSVRWGGSSSTEGARFLTEAW